MAVVIVEMPSLIGIEQDSGPVKVPEGATHLGEGFTGVS